MDDTARLQRSIGRDFLTYLCYRSDAAAGKIRFEKSGEECFVWIDGKIVFEDDGSTPPNIVAYTGDDFTSHDLKNAIRSGKRVREARLRIEKGQNTWTFTLRADRFDIAGLKIDMPGASDPEERLYGRLASIEGLNDIIDRLYDMFIAAIQDNNWKQHGSAAFQKWLNARGER
ncbi:MAG: hypothetical protein N3B18_10400 [Desulfobacterota bacterium]|nr:hypothetical protein [Thermodesulfobacteriota bacterium]